MADKIIYKCLNEKCKVEFKALNKDGIRCPVCGSPIIPLLKGCKALKNIDVSKVPDYMTLKKNNMVHKKSWEEFKDTGLLWWVNMILHTFGWSIVFNIDNGNITNVYPSRVKFRGFDNKSNTEGYINVSKYLKNTSNDLYKESLE